MKYRGHISSSISGLWTLAPAVALLIGLLLAPEAAVTGARRGLALCAGSVVPALLPFLCASGLLNALGLPRLLAKGPGKALTRLLGLPAAATAPLLLGFTGGYPVGAAALGDLVRRGELDRREAGRLLPVCNNTGPAFIIGAAGTGVFGSGKVGLALYAAHVLAALTLALLSRKTGKRYAAAEQPDETGAGTATAGAEPASLAKALPESVRGAVSAVLGISGFVVFFSVLLALLDANGRFSALAGQLAANLGAELSFVRALLTGLLELGGGIGALTGLRPTPGNLALASFLLGFGGLSVHCQTLAVLEGTDVPGNRLLPGRLLHGILAAGITLLLAR